MTEKQEKILLTALQLFAENGYDATSTSTIAKAAGVSEGLIFRHFTNKEGLLGAIMEIGIERAGAYFEQIIKEQDPGMRIKQALSLPFSIDESEHNFWKLMYTLKWQRGIYDNSKLELLLVSLTDAFNQLGYANPEVEARLVEVFIDGVATERLLKNNKSPEILETILTKYKLN